MSEVILETKSLSKSYGQVFALNNVSIKVCKGQIYGLIGKNGAGKTTLMRIIAGLTFPSSGNIELFGYSNEQEIKKMRLKTGFMIEAPSINPSMTAKENLSLHGIIKGVEKTNFENELIELVGLQDANRKKARNFSLGMKQRLGIALALVGNPELLVLDEPINGLDPIGVIEIRNLLIKLSKERNIAIMLSSHNLPELYQVATEYFIIDKGNVIKQLSLLELEKQCRQYLLIKTNQVETVVSLLEEKLSLTDFVVMADKSIRVFEGAKYVDEIAEILQINSIRVTNISIEGDSLENYFINLIGGNNNANSN